MDLRPLINRLVSDPAAKKAPDRATIEKLVTGFETVLEAREVKPTPFVVLRMHDVITQYRLARRIERAVFGQGVVVDPKNGAVDTAIGNGAAKQSARSDSLHPGIEPLAKAWERVRKALTELERVCGGDTSDHVPSLADLATPLLERADGVMEEAIAVENKRRNEVRELEARNQELEAKLSSAQ